MTERRGRVAGGGTVCGTEEDMLQLDPCSTLARAPAGNGLPRVAGRKGDFSKFSESVEPTGKGAGAVANAANWPRMRLIR